MARITAPAVIKRKKLGFVVSEGGRDIEREKETERREERREVAFGVSSLLLGLEAD
jgi:hypothetical protein